jgi:hypothetical protein
MKSPRAPASRGLAAGRHDHAAARHDDGADQLRRPGGTAPATPLTSSAATSARATPAEFSSRKPGGGGGGGGVPRDQGYLEPPVELRKSCNDPTVEGMKQLDDAVERQECAYNAHDLDGFVACYADDVVIEDADGGVVMRGHEAMRTQYGRLFATCPDVHAEVITRIRVGSFVIDEECVTGRPDGDIHAVAIYRLGSDGLIDRVRLLR